MDIISRLFGKEPEVKDPVDTPIEHVQTHFTNAAPRLGTHFRAPVWRNSTVAHKHHDGFGDPLHSWVEKRIQAIEATCTECGTVELHSDHAGRLKGAKMTPRERIGTAGLTRPLVVTPKPRRGSPEEKAKRNAEWKAYYESGQSVKSIAALYEVPESRVRDGLRRLNVKMHHRANPERGPRDDERAAEMLRLRAEEFWTYEQIGERYGVSRERVRQILKAGGADTRDLLHKKHLATASIFRPRTCVACGNPLPTIAELQAGTAEPWSDHVKRLHHRLMNLGARSTPEENAKRAAIAADYVAGIPEKDIQAKYGVSGMTVTYSLLQNGLTRNRSDKPKRMKTLAESRARAALMVADVESDMMKKDVAAKYGVSGSLVSQAVERAKSRG